MEREESNSKRYNIQSQYNYYTYQHLNCTGTLNKQDDAIYDKSNNKNIYGILQSEIAQSA